jgi:magnesium chelatase family protein
MNPCPCGQLGDESGLCNCSAEQISRYCSRISGPLLDRIDLHVEVSRSISFLLEHAGPQPESSEQVRTRVIAARLPAHSEGGTLADLEAKSDIGTVHAAEAISYRNCGAMRIRYCG